MKVIITGGTGFIGTNAAARHLRNGDDVVVIDNLSRTGAHANLAWLRSKGRFCFVELDIRDANRVAALFAQHNDATRVLHLAGQVAVTTSVADPRADFESNALGTFNVLEALRASGSEAAVLFASTNKVYGGLEHLDVVERDGRYTYARGISGVNEECPLDFHSPYGCSKGAADQYVRDYYRIYGIRTVVFRQSCIYGYRQFGVEDQGWVAWFTIATHLQRCLRIYGDGKQVRDVLFIDDLLDAYDAAFKRIDRAAGRVYNIGGGPDNAVSIQQFLEYLQRDVKRPLRPSYHCWRAGDQKVYISDIQRSADELGWTPRVPWREGVDLLSNWVRQNREVFQCV